MLETTLECDCVHNRNHSIILLNLGIFEMIGKKKRKILSPEEHVFYQSTEQS